MRCCFLAALLLPLALMFQHQGLGKWWGRVTRGRAAAVDKAVGQGGEGAAVDTAAGAAQLPPNQTWAMGCGKELPPWLRTRGEQGVAGVDEAA